MVLPIFMYGSQVLAAEAEEVSEETEGLQDLIDNMLDTVRLTKGIGLAAPQVGFGNRVVVIDMSIAPDEIKGDREWPLVLLNPEIIWVDEEHEEMKEGCLSLPGIYDFVPRSINIRLRYLDREFNEHEEEFEGLVAGVIQHEIDHLDGIYFIDYLSLTKRRMLKNKLRKITQGKIRAPYPIAVPSEVVKPDFARLKEIRESAQWG